MTTLEIVLVVFSVIETAVSAYMWRKWKRQLEAERLQYEEQRRVYESLIATLPIGRNLL